MTGHKHAALMLQYAQDAAETDKPWERWRARRFGEPWSDLCNLAEHPAWRIDFDYERKPKTIRIGEFDVPESMREAPALGSVYYNPHLVATNHFVTSTWSGNTWDKRLLSEGLVYPDEASAVLCARALLSLLEPRK